MRKLSILCAALFCLSLTASAQDSTAAFDASTRVPRRVSQPLPHRYLRRTAIHGKSGWGFSTLHFNVLGQTFHDFGYQAEVTRYLSNWFGVEGATAAGFGHVDTNSSH